MVVGIGKMDLEETRERAQAAKSELEARGIEVFTFSAATHEGVEAALTRLDQLLRENPTGGSAQEVPERGRAPYPARRRQTQRRPRVSRR